MSAQHDIFNYLFRLKLNSWTPLAAEQHKFFNDEEIALLNRSNRTFEPSRRTIVILSFENRFASLGGLAAVVRKFPGALRKAGEKVLLITPLHQGNSAVKNAIASGELIERFTGVKAHICNFSCMIRCYEEVNAAVSTLHIGIEGHFNAGENPYGYDNRETLLFDTLAFCAAVPTALSYLGINEHLLFHAHDWETAPIALFSRCAVISSLLQQVKTVLTLHNSFDSPFPDRFKKLFFNRTFNGDTILQCMLPLLDGPLTTVSTPFAFELRNDPLQRGFFVDHLQRHFAMNPPIGIENGMFGETATRFSQEELESAAKGDFKPLLDRKNMWRKAFFTSEAKETDPRISGHFNDELKHDPSAVIFFMSGRLDPLQKGFDVIFHAFKRLKPGSAYLFFTPTLHTGQEDLSFFNEIAKQSNGRIVIWPFLMPSRQYRTFLQGAGFLLMPSLYEPFGAANEGFLNATPVIARATGGLLAQVHAGKEFEVPSQYARIVPLHHSDEVNGILFKERLEECEAQSQWRSLFELPVKDRMKNPLYVSIVDAATEALNKAITIFSDNDAYGAMLFNGQRYQGYTWKEAAAKYRAVFDVACTRG